MKALLIGGLAVIGITCGLSIEHGSKNRTSNAIDLPERATPFQITVPDHVSKDAFPQDNPLITQRVALGEKLFHDVRLSRDHTISCASCHTGGTLADPRRFSMGIGNRPSRRQSMPLFNLAWKESFFWDGRVDTLREQVLVPITHPAEMGESLDNVVNKLKKDEGYQKMFSEAFASGEISPHNISLALENFLLTKLSFDSKYDQMIKGKADFTEEEKHGMELFFTKPDPANHKRGASCFECHSGTIFSDNDFHNNGLSPTRDAGRFRTTKKASDRNKFATPSLRNIELTAPYMHDGRFHTLEAVLDHYTSPFVRSSTLDRTLAKHPHGLDLDDEEKKALVAFLKTLTDPSLK